MRSAVRTGCLHRRFSFHGFLVPRCLISLGANLGNRELALDQAVQRISQHPCIQLIAASQRHETKPVGGPPDQRDFVNAAAQLETSLPPERLLDFLLAIEANSGRVRGQRWGARQLDLDLLLYGTTVLSTAALTLPHARMAFRRFVLVPAAEIASEMIHPTTGWTIRQLLDHLNNAPNYLAITGVCGVAKNRLAWSATSAGGVELLQDPTGGLGVAASNDRAGLDGSSQLEFLQRRAQLLRDRLGHPQEFGKFYVSDYWLGESDAYAQVTLEAHERDALRITCHQLRASVARPKLLVFFDYLTPPSPPQRRPRVVEDFRRELSDQINRSPETPVLTLAGDDPAWAAAEITAAIQAIRGVETSPEPDEF